MSDTPTANPTRELAAIMFSDIAGYTAIIGVIGEARCGRIPARRELLDALVPRFDGPNAQQATARSRLPPRSRRREVCARDPGGARGRTAI